MRKQIFTTFDEDKDGWKGRAYKAQWTGDDGDPAGAVRISSGNETGNGYLYAPKEYLGDKSEFLNGTFSLDYKGDIKAGIGLQLLGQADQRPFLALGNLKLVGQFHPGEWNHYEIKLDEQHFSDDGGDLRVELGHLAGFHVAIFLGEHQSGEIDNMKLTGPANHALGAAFGGDHFEILPSNPVSSDPLGFGYHHLALA